MRRLASKSVVMMRSLFDPSIAVLGLRTDREPNHSAISASPRARLARAYGIVRKWGNREASKFPGSFQLYRYAAIKGMPRMASVIRRGTLPQSPPL